MKTSHRWHSSKTHPPRKGWYETRGVGESDSVDWRAWGCGCWWRQIKGGWIGFYDGDGEVLGYEWCGPRQSIDLDYKELKR